MSDEITKKLFELQDRKYQAMQFKIIPTVSPETIIGVRTPELRSYAKELLKSDEASAFLEELPHRYFDENQLHAFILSELKDYGLCLGEVDRFLPYVDNWATCDQMSPKVFKKAPERASWSHSQVDRLREDLYHPIRHRNASGTLSRR